MKKFVALLAAALTVVPSLAFASVAFAASPGNLSSGPDMYLVKNVTKGSAYATSASATCSETVKYSLQLSNSEFGLVSNINVKASLANGDVTASGTNAAGATTSVAGHVDVTVDKGSLKYVAGSAQLLDVNGNRIAGVADSVVTTGANVGNLNGSTREFVQFQAKVECETPPAPKNITVCELATKKVITIREDQFDASKYSRDLNKCAEVPTPGKIQVCELATKKIVTIDDNKFDASKYSRDLNKCAEVLGTETPAAIASTGPTSTIATMAGLSALAAGVTYFVQRRRNILG